jgi:chromosomal replication initiator protein
LGLPAEPDLLELWREISTAVRRIVDDSTYDIWLAELAPRALSGDILTLAGPPARQGWVSRRFGGVLQTCATEVVGHPVRVQFDSGETHSSYAGRTTEGHPELDVLGALNPRYSFDQFVIGEGNRLAHAAALAVAELPGQAYNPLFIHAPPGLGKTHLLHAIGNYAMAYGDGTRVRYTTVEAFTNHFIASLGSRSVERFKHVYRDVDVLLIDDVQFLASKAKTEEEFFHTFNALYETGRQLVLTCDRLPRQLSAVSERLRERFEAGLVADVGPPDFATRLAILRKRAALDRLRLADAGVLELIAERITDNVRALEGALIRVVAHHSLTGQPIDVAFASRVLDGMHPRTSVKAPRPEEIKKAVASFYDVSESDLTSSTRVSRVAWPRQLAIYLTRELTDEPLAAIGRSFGGRNHATVLHACKRVSERLRVDGQTEREVEDLSSALRVPRDDRRC